MSTYGLPCTVWNSVAASFTGCNIAPTVCARVLEWGCRIRRGERRQQQQYTQRGRSQCRQLLPRPEKQGNHVVARYGSLRCPRLFCLFNGAFSCPFCDLRVLCIEARTLCVRSESPISIPDVTLSYSGFGHWSCHAAADTWSTHMASLPSIRFRGCLFESAIGGDEQEVRTKAFNATHTYQLHIQAANDRVRQ